MDMAPAAATRCFFDMTIGGEPGESCEARSGVRGSTYPPEPRGLRSCGLNSFVNTDSRMFHPHANMQAGVCWMVRRPDANVVHVDLGLDGLPRTCCPSGIAMRDRARPIDYRVASRPNCFRASTYIDCQLLLVGSSDMAGLVSCTLAPSSTSLSTA